MNKRNANVLAAMITACVAVHAGASAWPTKPVRVVVPYAAGSTTDIVPRAVLDQLGRELGQSMVVDNRAGAGGTIGAALVAKSAADGHTLLVNSSAHTIAPALYPNLPYHPARDFVAVVPLGISVCALVVSPEKRYRSVSELISAARARPGGLNFSSVGVGTATHLSAERFRLSARVPATHVPFKGGAEAMTEVLAGRADFFFGPIGLVLPHIKEGRLHALVVNGHQRAAALPDVPTTQQAGFANAEYPIWFGVFAPARTPRAIVERLHHGTVKALGTAKVRERLVALGVDPMIMTPAEFDTFIEKAARADATLVQAVAIAVN